MTRKQEFRDAAFDRPVTSQDVAERAQVSRAAVSRTFSRNGSVSDKTRAKVLKAAEELGYQVNMLGRSMNRQRVELIGVLVRRLQDPFRAALTEALLQAISTRGQEVIVTEISGASESEAAVQRFVQYRVSGVVVTSGSPPAAIANECLRFGVPVVTINRGCELDHVDVVRSDNAEGARLAAERLLAAGCRHLGFLNVEGGTYSGAARGVAFVEALAPYMVDGQVSFRQVSATEAGYRGGYTAALALRDAAAALDGVFCANDLLACGLLDGLRGELGLEIPGDISVIGFDDIPAASWGSYRLTTLRQDATAIAEVAVNCLLGAGDREGAGRRIHVVPTAMVERGTVAPRLSPGSEGTP